MLGLGFNKTPNLSSEGISWWQTLYPGAVLVADFANGRAAFNDNGASFTDFLTITRASEGFAENTDNTLIKYSANEIRLSNRGVLIESASTNVLLNSQNTTASQWSLIGNAEISENVISAPDSTLTADRVYNLTSTGDGLQYTDDISYSIASNTFTFSLYMKGLVASDVEITIAANTGSAVSTTQIFSITTDWKRVSLTHTFSADNNDFTVFIRRPSAATITSFYVWGAQFEQKPFASSYITTASSPLTRPNDAIYFHNLSWLNESNGTLLMDVQSDQGTISNRRILGFASAQGLETSPIDTVLENWNGSLLLQVNSGNGQGWEEGAKLGLTWDSNGRALSMCSGLISEDSLQPGNLSSMYLGSRDGTSSFWEGYIDSIKYYSYRMGNSELLNKTA